MKEAQIAHDMSVWQYNSIRPEHPGHTALLLETLSAEVRMNPSSLHFYLS